MIGRFRPDRLRDVRDRLALSARVLRDTSPPLASRYAHHGERAVVVPPARVVNPQFISIGDDVVIHEHAWLTPFPTIDGVTPRLEIGSRTRIGRFAHIACVGEVRIASDVLTADMIFIADTYHAYEDPTRPIIDQSVAPPRPVVIERGAFLGIRSVVMPGVTVGENAFVGASAVVFDDVPPRSVVVGNPARVVRLWDPAKEAWVSV